MLVVGILGVIGASIHFIVGTLKPEYMSAVGRSVYAAIATGSLISFALGLRGIITDAIRDAKQQ